jgi:signal transduction histidine kinase
MAVPINLLIVENSEDDAMLIADRLCQAGYDLNLRRVETARELSAALRPPASWDLILSDYSLPGFSGMAALEIYKCAGLDIPFILISGSIGEQRAVEAMRSGVHDYIMKDNMGRLAPAVDRELREAANRRDRREKVELLLRSRADLEQVTWAASHDLKEPLRMVATYTQMLLRGRHSSDPEEVEFSRYITDGVERLAALIDGLVEYSRNLRAPVDLTIRTDADAVAREALRNLAPMIDECSATIAIDPLPAVNIEHDALLDVLQQLLTNAIAYRRDGVPPSIRVTATWRSHEICFAIQDNGIGIKPEHQERIFQLFRRLHGTEYPGIGVGLPLSKRLIENYGGRLWVESEPGVGSTFFFTVTAADRASTVAR